MTIARLILALLFALSLSAQTSPGQTWEVHAIRYATLKDFSVSGLVRGADPTRKMDIAMMIWLIRGEGRTILFDSGFYRQQFMQQWHPADYSKPSDALTALHIKPEDVTDVVLSHIHWDHADGFDLFPQAKIWIQKDELEYYSGEAWQGHTRTAADPEVLLGLVRLNTQGRVILVNGDDQELFPGIRAYTGGKHTWQSQFLGVRTAAGTVILASDNAYLYENLETRTPIGQTLDADSNLRALLRMRQLASRPGLVVPGHDPGVMEIFPVVAPGIVRIQ